MKNTDTPSIERLKECPFCGSEATVEQPSKYFAVECSECFCEGPSGADAAEAARHWNRRAALPTRREGLEEVAQRVYDGMRWAAERAENGQPPRWVEGGNSFAQTEARNIARTILATLETLPSAGEGVDVNGLRALLANVAQLLDTIKVEWEPGGHWSEWDASVREDLTRHLRALTPSPPLEQPDIEGRARELLHDALNAAYRQAYKDGFVDAQPEPPEDERDIHRLIDTGALADGWTNFLADEGDKLIAALSLPTTEIRREALEEAARIVERRIQPEEAARLIGAPDAQESPYQYFRRATVAKLRSLALASPPSRPSFDKWDYARAVLKDSEGCGR